MSKIAGLTCFINDQRIQQIIERVLRQVQERRPDDFERLRRKVRAFRWLPRAEDTVSSATMGCWFCEKRARETKRFKKEIEIIARCEVAKLYGVDPACLTPEHYGHYS